MKKLLLPLLLLVSSGLFLAGCGSANSDTITAGLRVELTGIERTGDGTVTVAWQLVNPNVTPYLLDRVSHRIFLNGTLVGTTLDAKATAFPAQSTTSKTTKLTLAGPAAERLLAEAAAKGRAEYRVDTQVTVRLYSDMMEKSDLTHAGSVPVTAK